MVTTLCHQDGYEEAWYDGCKQDSKFLRHLGAPGLRIFELYRVTQKVSDLGWVDLDLECSTILLGQ